MTTNEPPENLPAEYDVVVIGAGVSGLTSAALLSRAGLSVLVLESDSRPGGYLAGFRRKHFRFDSAIHWLNQCGKNGIGTKIFDFLGSDWPKPKPQQRIRRLKSDRHDYLLTNNPDELRDQLILDFPDDRKGIMKFFNDARQISRFFNIYHRIFRTVETMSWRDQIRLRLFQMVYGWPFLKHIRFAGEDGIERGLKKYFKDPGLRAIFCMESDLLGCLIPIAWAYNGDFQSPPERGSIVIPEWLCYVVRYHQGEISLRSRVNEVLLENNRVKGVRYERGSKQFEVHAPFVLAACDVELLYERLLPKNAIAQDLKDRLKKAELYSSSVTINLSLDCTAEELGFDEEMIFMVRSDISRDEHSSGNPEKSMVSIIAPTLRDKTLSPEGQGILTIYTGARIDYGDYWKCDRDENGGYIRGEAYKRFKEEYAQTLIKRVEKNLQVDLRNHILATDIATPITHWRYTGNRDGSIMGAVPGEQNMKSKLAHHQTPVEGLILGGHWSEYGGGVPIAVKAGANSSLLILKLKNPDAYKSLAKYMDGNEPARYENVAGFAPYDNSWVPQPTPAEKLKTRLEEDKVV